MLRFPTQAETDQGFAIQCAEDAARAQNPVPREPRDQDLERFDAPVQPLMILTDEALVPPQPRVPKVFCPECGRVFTYARRGIAVREMTKHRARAHPDTVEAY